MIAWALANWKVLAGAAVGLALIVGAWLIFHKGEQSGKATIRTEIQTQTIKKLDDARISKEKTDEEVVRTPWDDRVDGLR